jgi:hypothetical protein
MGHRPQIVTCRATGKAVRTREHRCKWHGKSNDSKARSLLVLYSLWSKCQDDTGLCAIELSESACVSLATLKSELPDWIRWEYVKRKTKEYRNNPVFSYFINRRGVHFVEDIIPPGKRDELINEIKEARLKRTVSL